MSVTVRVCRPRQKIHKNSVLTSNNHLSKTHTYGTPIFQQPFCYPVVNSTLLWYTAAPRLLLCAYLRAQRLVHSGISPRLHQLRVHPETQATSESHRAQRPQGVIEEGLAGGQGGTHQAQAEVGGTLARVVLDDAGVDVVEQGVDREVSARRCATEAKGCVCVCVFLLIASTALTG